MLLFPSAWSIRESRRNKVIQRLWKITTNFHEVILQKVNITLVLTQRISYFRGFQHKYISRLEAGKCGMMVFSLDDLVREEGALCSASLVVNLLRFNRQLPFSATLCNNSVLTLLWKLC